MARALRRWYRGGVPDWKPSEAQMPEPMQLFQLMGHNKTLPLHRLPEGVARMVQNLAAKDGAYQVRDATVGVGSTAAGDMTHATEAILSSGSSYLVRFGAAGVEVYSAGVWNATAGAAWSTISVAPFSITGWKDTLIFASDTGGVYSLAFTAGYPKTLLYALVGVIHLTTFGKRVIASTTAGIYWTVSGNSGDWTGIGSGFEDLLSSPGGRPDQQTAVIPVSDEIAIAIRSQSFWQMSRTGDFDAPFSFSRMYDGQGSRWPRTCVGIPRGCMCLGDDGSVYKLTLDGGLKDVGHPIKTDLQSTPAYLRLAVATYDPRNNRYRLTIPTTSLTESKVYEYSIDDDHWTESWYPFPIRSISFALFAQEITVDELIGIVDNLVGTVDDLVTGIQRAQILFAMKDTRRYVAQESFPKNNDPTRDIRYDGTRIASGFQIETAPVRRGSILNKVSVVDIILEYEAALAVTLKFYYSDNNGSTWNLITTIVAPATVNSEQIRFQYHLDRKNLQYKVSCDASPHVRLVDLIARAAEGGMKVDAS